MSSCTLCDREVWGRGLCRRHYDIERKAGRLDQHQPRQWSDDRVLELFQRLLPARTPEVVAAMGLERSAALRWLRRYAQQVTHGGKRRLFPDYREAK